MKYVNVEGSRISAIGLGAGSSGRRTGATASRRERTAVDFVHTALDRGVNLIDTAEVYAHGASEMIVGRALMGRREEAFVATKVLPIWPTAWRVEEHGRLSALRLGVESIDLYQVHWPNPPCRLGRDGRDAPPPGFRHRPPRRREQLLSETVGERRDRARPAGATNQVQYSLLSANPTRPSCRTRSRTAGS